MFADLREQKHLAASMLLRLDMNAARKEVIWRNMAKPNNYKTVFMRTLVYFIIVQQGTTQLLFFRFTLNLLTERTTIIYSCLLISSLKEAKKMKIVYDI